jgi:hypothetical protein
MTLRRNAGRSVRPGLESLESRTLLSSSMPTALAAPPAIVGHSAAAAIHIDHTTPAATTQHAAPATASFAYHWSVGPSSVLVGTNTITRNRASTGSVDFALVRDSSAVARLGGPASTVPVGFLLTTSSAGDGLPDHFNTPFTIRLRLRDAASGATGEVTFKGRITGTLSWDHSGLQATFLSPTTQKITLGKHVYTVSLPATLVPNGPYDMPTTVFARIQVATATAHKPAGHKHHGHKHHGHKHVHKPPVHKPLVHKPH